MKRYRVTYRNEKTGKEIINTVIKKDEKDLQKEIAAHIADMAKRGIVLTVKSIELVNEMHGIDKHIAARERFYETRDGMGKPQYGDYEGTGWMDE